MNTDDTGITPGRSTRRWVGRQRIAFWLRAARYSEARLVAAYDRLVELEAKGQ